MTALNKFHEMAFEEKCNLITFSGTYLTSKDFGKDKVYLFYLNGFFAEIWYNIEKSKVHGVNAFTSNRGLEVYCDEIEIDELKSVLQDGYPDF